MERLNPLTGKHFKQGDLREDGLKFWSYNRSVVKGTGYYAEQWYSKDVFHRLRVKNIIALCRRRCEKLDIPFNVTVDYLMSIYPTDGMCPILNVKMEWGEEVRENSPSLDKIIPKLGYIQGNVAWISRKANELKNDASIEQLEAILKYMKFHLEPEFKKAA